MKNRFFKVGIFTVAILLGLSVNAQDKKDVKKGGSPEKMIERLDTDKDGKLNLEEVSKAKKGKLAENFKMIDTNSDGLLEVAELSANLPGKKGGKKSNSPKNMIEHLDADKDGKLNLEEVSKAKKGKLAEQFKTIDANSDGLLEAAELKAYRKEKREKRS